MGEVIATMKGVEETKSSQALPPLRARSRVPFDSKRNAKAQKIVRPLTLKDFSIQVGLQNKRFMDYDFETIKNLTSSEFITISDWRNVEVKISLDGEAKSGLIQAMNRVLRKTGRLERSLNHLIPLVKTNATGAAQLRGDRTIKPLLALYKCLISE